MSKSIIFDMDGTLFQTDLLLEYALEDTFEHLRSMDKWNDPTPLQQYREIMGVPLPQVWETLLPNHSTKDRYYIDSYFLEKLLKNISDGNGSLYPNTKEILGYLYENHYSIYIASNGLTVYLEAIVSHYQLDQWITEIFSIQQIDSLNKSDLVKRIIEQYGITNAAVVGDRLSDFNAARENGLLSIGCNFDYAKEDELSHAHCVIDDLMELKEILSPNEREG